MKISFIALKDLPYIGGMEKYTEELGTRLVEKGFKVVVYTSGRNSGKHSIYKGMQIVPVSTLPVKGLERFIVSRIATIKASFSSTDIIHYHSFENTLLTWIPRLMGKKVIYQGHGLEWERDRWGRVVILYFKIVNYIVNRFPRIFFNKAVVVSNYQKEYYFKNYGNDFKWIPTGVNITEPLKPDLIRDYQLIGKDYIFFAARLVKEKGAHFLISAYNEAKQKLKKDIKLVIAGDAPDEKEYKACLKELAGDDRNIIFTGSVSGNLLVELYSNAALFVLPSTIEGMPISLIEAMNLGAPTLSSNIGPNLETSGNGKYGFHFESRNVHDLSEKIIELLGDEELLKSKTDAAQKYVRDNFTWDHVFEEFLNLYTN
jgi:glycosyltransferase involved in cell wall biosynthesis